MSDAIWYAAYGTNLSSTRLRHYLEGGTPAGASRATPGSRDPGPPRDVRPIVLPGSVYFAWDSPTWGGGVAFYDPRRPSPGPGARTGTGATDGSAVGRAYLLSRHQFSDLAAQEMHRLPGTDLDLGGLLSTGTWSFGPGRYDTMHVVGAVDGAPVVTFTADWGDCPTPYRAPSAAYLGTMGRGLRESHGWEPDRVAAYLMGCAGIGPDWTRESVLALVAGEG